MIQSGQLGERKQKKKKVSFEQRFHAEVFQCDDPRRNTSLSGVLY